MKARPILFSSPMVRALLAGTKTQTRRVVKPQPSGHHWAAQPQRADYSCGYRNLHSDVWQFEHRIALNPQPDADGWIRCPYGALGDLLWVREAWRVSVGFCHLPGSQLDPSLNVAYEADPPENLPAMHRGRYRHARFMPRWASRLTLRITDVRVQRLQEISGADAIEEGIDIGIDHDYIGDYRLLWESINGPGSWDANPWVWALTFDVTKANVDQVLASV